MSNISYTSSLHLSHLPFSRSSNIRLALENLLQLNDVRDCKQAYCLIGVGHCNLLEYGDMHRFGTLAKSPDDHILF